MSGAGKGVLLKLDTGRREKERGARIKVILQQVEKVSQKVNLSETYLC